MTTNTLETNGAGVLAIYLGRVCGFAYGSNGRDGQHTWLSGTPFPTRALSTIERICDVTRPGTIVVQGLSRNWGRDGQRIYCDLIRWVLNMAGRNQAKVVAANVGQVKKHWTGNGNASADTMFNACIKRDIWPAFDPEVTAIALLDYTLCTRSEA